MLNKIKSYKLCFWPNGIIEINSPKWHNQKKNKIYEPNGLQYARPKEIKSEPAEKEER